MQTFNEYLWEVFLEERYDGDKRSLPDPFDDWVLNMEPEDWMIWGDRYALKCVRVNNESYMKDIDKVIETLKGGSHD